MRGREKPIHIQRRLCNQYTNRLQRLASTDSHSPNFMEHYNMRNHLGEKLCNLFIRTMNNYLANCYLMVYMLCDKFEDDALPAGAFLLPCDE